MAQHKWYGSNEWMKHCLWIILVLTLLFVLCALIKLLQALYKKHRKDKSITTTPRNSRRTLNHSIKIFSVFGLIFYIIATIIFLTAEIYQNSYSWTGYPYPFICITWGTANIFAYLLYIFRLKISFTNTAYETSASIFYLFYFLIVLFLLSQILETILLVGEGYSFLSVATAQVFFIATFGWDQLVDGIMSVMLLVIFINKLFKVTINTIDYQAMSERNIRRQRDSISLNNNQKRYLHLVTKQFVLSTYAILSTQSYIFWNSFSGIVYSDIVWIFNDDINYGLYVICVVLFCNDCIANTVAIYLNFSFNDQLYGNVCKSCDLCCGYCCETLAKKKAKKQMQINNDYVQLAMN